MNLERKQYISKAFTIPNFVFKKQILNVQNSGGNE